MKLLGLIVAVAVVGAATARIEDLTISGDIRRVYDIESFGFEAGGRISVALRNLRFVVPEGANGTAIKAGLFLAHVSSAART